MALREELHAVVLSLVEHPGALDLDAVCEAIGTRAVTFEEIGLILDELEARGRKVVEAPVTARESLLRVLRSARELKAALGRSPTSSEIAAHSGLSPASVRLGLLFSALLQR